MRGPRLRPQPAKPHLSLPVSVMVIWLTLPDPVSLALTFRMPAGAGGRSG